MPIYEFVCDYGHQFEMFLPIRALELIKQSGNNGKFFLEHEFKFSEGSNVSLHEQRCRALVTQKWSTFNTTQIAKSTKYFYNPNTGEKRLATNSHQKAPYGFVEKELKGSIERSKFEKEQQQVSDIKNELEVRRLQHYKDETTRTRQDDVKAKLTTIADKSENPALTKDLLKHAMNRSRNKKLPSKKKDVMFQVNHVDKSNMD